LAQQQAAAQDERDSGRNSQPRRRHPGRPLRGLVPSPQPGDHLCRDRVHIELLRSAIAELVCELLKLRVIHRVVFHSTISFNRRTAW
jgi:hypothetical protein